MSDNTAVALTASDTAVAPKTKGKAGRPVEPNSKLAQCKALFIQLAQDGKNRAEILAEFTSRFNLKAGSAQVYYHEAKNAAEEAGHQFTVKRSPSTPRVAKVTEASAGDVAATADSAENAENNG